MGVIAAAVRELIALNVQGDALVAAIERMEAAQERDAILTEKVIDAAERRREKDRERKRRLRNSAEISGQMRTNADAEMSANSADKCGQTRNSAEIPHSPYKEDNILPISKVSSSSSSSVKASRLASDWRPPDELVRYAIDKAGLTQDEVDRAAEDFRDYWTAKAGTAGRHTDWAATWRRWVRTTADRKRERQPRMASGPQTSRSGSAPQSFVDIILENRAGTGR